MKVLLNKNRIRDVVLCFILSITFSCGTNPYPAGNADEHVYYTSYAEDPKHLDPAVSYYEHEAAIIDNIYETLYQYNYLKRPFQLEPALAETFPIVTVKNNSDTSEPTVVYSIKIKKGILFHDDPSLPFSEKHHINTREVIAEDFVNAFKRLSDPKISCPVRPIFASIIKGFDEFTEANKKLNKTNYDISISGVKALDNLTLEITLTHPYPQLQYWLAMHFTSPIPREAIEYYRVEGRPTLDDHPIGTGPYKLKTWEKRLRVVLEKNPLFRTEYYPDTGEANDLKDGLLDFKGSKLPLLDKIYMAYEVEAIPRWRKFLQGWYDGTGLSREVFDRVVTEQRGLSEEMEKKGMKLVRMVEPSIFYFAFNMNDPIVGGGSERAKKLRQALSLSYDVPAFLRILMNGRGEPSNEIIPPGIFGHKGDTSPYMGPNREKAKKLLEEAGYPYGIDPKTNRPLVITFDNNLNNASDRPMLQFIIDQFSSIGIHIEPRTTDLNTYRTKIREGNYQLIMSGWNLDYPDPENVLFLLEGSQATIPFGGENNANFRNPEYDRLYKEMARMENTEERERIIHNMIDILREDCPWIPIFFRESYTMTHSWVKNFKPAPFMNNVLKYRDIDPTAREKYREAESKPIYYPLFLIAILLLLGTVIGIRSLKRKES